jgi:hypothetical protein
LFPYLSFIRREKESKEDGKKKKEENEMIWFVSNTPNWVQIGCKLKWARLQKP